MAQEARGRKAKVYVTQIGLYIIANPQMFQYGHSKIIFLISYLTSQASTWAQPYTVKLFVGQPVFMQRTLDGKLKLSSASISKASRKTYALL
ncbi:hypothetical protein PTTG_03857 [Puccinia triticina 1-1 BBBD Race 1]|uniref:DUF4939 domain-containing protein n=1 Tax=Puccinia triticina (isolate 1-1 / race 1 (BBBD)) TaxID=630390 RepID=A0A0C4ESS8_PUCT1|nr:hypothetical protein PTTG_03857 [Puccinia triticina 1-1 BBBD Race 1]